MASLNFLVKQVIFSDSFQTVIFWILFHLGKSIAAGRPNYGKQKNI